MEQLQMSMQEEALIQMAKEDELKFVNAKRQKYNIILKELGNRLPDDEIDAAHIRSQQMKYSRLLEELDDDYW